MGTYLHSLAPFLALVTLAGLLAFCLAAWLSRKVRACSAWMLPRGTLAMLFAISFVAVDYAQKRISPGPATVPDRAVSPLSVPQTRFTAISVTPSNVALSAEWPEGLIFPGDALGVYAAGTLTNEWEWLGDVTVSGGMTNLELVLEAADFPGAPSAMPSMSFFRLGLAGTLPPDTDGDGIPDADEAGGVTILPDFEWHDTSGFTTVYGTRQPGMWGYFGNSASAAFSVPVRLCDVDCASLQVFENGYVSILASGDIAWWTFPEQPLPLWSHAYNSGTFLVAPYWSGLFLAYGDTNSYLRIGHDASAAATVVEFHDVRRGFGSTDGATFQVVVPDGTGDVVRVSYLSADFWMDGSGAVVGVQDKTHTSSNGYAHIDWDFSAQGPILPQTTVEYRFGTGTDPTRADSDDDGIDDAYELYLTGTDPWNEDTDGDGLDDGNEAALGTDPLNADTDGDGLGDGDEVALGTDPLNADTDGDGLSDGWEQTHGLDPLDAAGDADADGLTDAQETALGTDPLQPDTDGDGLGDGWEQAHGFDPLTDNATDTDPGNDIDADPDGDGLSNADECAWGTDPHLADTDGDGVADGTEIAQGSDPADAADGGQPGSRTFLRFTFGDHSGSHSEKYRLTLKPVQGSGIGAMPRTISWTNARYGACETQTAPLKPGWRYEASLRHMATDPAYDGTPRPDYDYTLEHEEDLPPHVLFDDPHGLFGVDETGAAFAAEGKVATLDVLDIAVEEIRFNHDRGACTVDAMNLLKRNAAGMAIGVSSGEWADGGATNDPVCYAGGVTPTVKVRFRVSPAVLSGMRIAAETVAAGSPLGGLAARDVSFSNGLSELVDFTSGAAIPRVVRRIDHRWAWRVTRLDAPDISHTVDFICTTTGPHRVYTVLGELYAPWDANADNLSTTPRVDALDFACEIAQNMDTERTALAALTSYLFSDMGFRYDTKDGDYAYWDGRSFNASDYLERRYATVNCVDQAYAVVTFGNLLGACATPVRSTWFGFINSMNIVGVGLCNNPFYESVTNVVRRVTVNGEVVFSDFAVPSTPLCNVDYIGRTYFANHMYVIAGGAIFDACAGPALGTQTHAEYLDSVIDHSTEDERWYGRFADSPPGGVALRTRNFNVR